MKSRTRVKICGITTLQDAEQAALLGADSIGLVFHNPSPRYIDIESAIGIRQALPPFVTVTALFLNESEAWVEEVVRKVRPDCLQFHGTESNDFCCQWKIPFIKTIPMSGDIAAQSYAKLFPQAQGFLLDSNAAGRMGGSGDTFDWSEIPSSFTFPLILAGGLKPSNVAQAILQVKPWAVDVSSGVEAAKGIKDAQLVKDFFLQVEEADKLKNEC